MISLKMCSNPTHYWVTKLVTSITTDKHKFKIRESNITALSAFDHKRYYLSVVFAYAYDHYRTGQKQKKKSNRNSKVL